MTTSWRSRFRDLHPHGSFGFAILYIVPSYDIHHFGKGDRHPLHDLNALAARSKTPCQDGPTQRYQPALVIPGDLAPLPPDLTTDEDGSS